MMPTLFVPAALAHLAKALRFVQMPLLTCRPVLCGFVLLPFAHHRPLPAVGQLSSYHASSVPELWRLCASQHGQLRWCLKLASCISVHDGAR